MASQDKHDDTGSETASEFHTPILTPATTSVAGEDVEDDHVSDIPWPGKHFYIIEKETGKAITLVDDRPVLMDLQGVRDPATMWYCVEKQGYFGFLNKSWGKFIGHNSKSDVGVWAGEMREWESWVPRQHPDGGYQLLSPYWTHTMMQLCVCPDRINLCRRSHGPTLWEFMQVPW
ncbi:hypothetical protein HER10_EVM0010216 [Colletotrichum scovillei]|nr:uncharacterized protein HER10_EVM0010216 [Colletotrichum scovillei]KAF4785816.1 hypothetical protein HER10_EVM0010216 [Colletotrichum scovillei]KAG7074263.1 major facilitator superfamily transporter multidrug resistance [Colletotrichum scovillei]KAG7081224.1 major facilitator superfamily transporter multidrug resistance [Colletotrichum scovillei]KXH44225.1 hypothetical protein CNYM01_08553 [Colletotrichum nymphaeae SA-01]